MTGPDLWDYDWAQTGTHGRTLHAPRLTPAQRTAIDDGPYDGVAGLGDTACGRRDVWLRIPGVFSRLSAPRCEHCCRALGYPHGPGSPKNDAAIRPLLGLAPTTAKETNA